MPDQGAPPEIAAVLEAMRPRLHRYCARMTGSSVDGEDIVQDAMLKALKAAPDHGVLADPEGWLFRIAHNTALDFLRRRARGPLMHTDEVLAMIAAPPEPERNDDIVRMSLRTFMRLPPLQRSAVILKDVLDHSLEEVASIAGVTEPAAKSALQRGRVRLRELGQEPDEASPPALPDAVLARLTSYVEGFQAGDFDSVRAMLADEVRLDLVARLQRQGAGQVGDYFSRYAECTHWVYAPGVVDGHPAMVVYDRNVSLAEPAYFVALTFEGDRVVAIHDFLFARYAMEGIAMEVIAR